MSRLRLNGRWLPGTVPRLRGIVCVAVAALLLGNLSCGRGSVLDRARKEYDAGRYREAIFIIRHHFRRGGERMPGLLLIAGKSYLRLGIEAEAEDSFAELYSTDTTWAPEIAQVLKKEALSSIESGLETRGKRFLLQAINYDSMLDFGASNRIAGELLLENKNYDNAIRYLERYIAEYPDTTGAAQVMLNLGEAYEGKGETETAISLYHNFEQKYPKSRLRPTVQWKLENLILKAGQDLRAGGDPEKAGSMLLGLARSAGNPLIRERANFILAEICEERGEYAKAVAFYTEVVNLNLGSSGRLVEKSKERIVRIERTKPGH